MMDYMIAGASGPVNERVEVCEDLECAVQNCIFDGWVPLGGVAVTVFEGVIGFYQAMTLPRRERKAQQSSG